MLPRLLAAAVSAVVLAGCGDSDPAAVPSTTTAAPAPSTTSSTAPAEPEAAAALADGRHPGYLRAVDDARRTVTVDVIQFLTGDEARKAYEADGNGELDGDYYIRNTNPKLRTLSLVVEVEITLLETEMGGTDSAKSVPAALGDLARVVARGQPANPFWLTVAGGSVTEVEQQYLP